MFAIKIPFYSFLGRRITLKQQNLITSTILLTLSALLVRTIGMISMIYLTQMLGSEGVGIYELIISLYMTAVIFASAGLSASVSRMVAEELGQNGAAHIKKIMKAAFSIALFTGFTASAGLFISAPVLSHYFIHTTYATWPLRFLSLCIPFIACSSCIKGYFYATKKAIYPASSDVMEQFVKLGLIYVLIKHYAPLGTSYIFQGAAMGLTFGELISWSYLFSLFIFEARKAPAKKSSSLKCIDIIKRFLRILLPIAMISYVSYIFVSVENILIPSGFKKFGESFSSSMSLYGILKGMVLPILFFPSAFLTAFSTTLIPEIARSNVLGYKKRVSLTTTRVLQLTFILSLLVVSIFLSYGNELGFILYKTDTIGPMLRVLSTIVPFVYIEVIADGILKGLDKQVSCLKYSLIDAVCRIILIYFLLPIKGMYALMGIMIASCIFTSSLNFNKLLKETGLHFNLSAWLIKPTLAAAFAGCYSRLIISRLFRYSFGLTTKIFLGTFIIILFYFGLLFLIKTITNEDLMWIKKQLSLLSIIKKTSPKKGFTL